MAIWICINEHNVHEISKEPEQRPKTEQEHMKEYQPFFAENGISFEVSQAAFDALHWKNQNCCHDNLGQTLNKADKRLFVLDLWNNGNDCYKDVHEIVNVFEASFDVVALLQRVIYAQLWGHFLQMRHL